MALDPATTVRAAWDRLSRIPGGKKLFSRAVGLQAPYTATLGADVVELGPGWCKTRLRDRRGVRNHLRSIHAAALMNLGEMTSGLAFVYSLPAGARGILVRFTVEYVKKARGTLTGECALRPPATAEEKEYDLEAAIKDAGGEVVARAVARWRVGPIPR